MTRPCNNMTSIMDPLIKKAYNAARKGQSYAFATVVEATKKGTPRKAGAKMLVLADGSIVGSIGGGRYEKACIAESLKAIRANTPTTAEYEYFGKEGQSICGGKIKVFIEPFAGQKHFIICGAGHIALPLSVIGKMLNYRVTIIDDRKDFANKTRFPHADRIVVGAHAGTLAKEKITPETLIMIVTQGNEYDFACLKAVVESPAGYIGVISSQPKKIKFINRLREAGVAAAALKRLHIPAGIDLGAQTPEEIAVSIAAEIVRAVNTTNLGTAKFKFKKGSKD